MPGDPEAVVVPPHMVASNPEVVMMMMVVVVPGIRSDNDDGGICRGCDEVSKHEEAGKQKCKGAFHRMESYMRMPRK